MKTAIAEIKGLAAISFSRRYDMDVPRLEGESHAAYDERNWREHLHYNPKTREAFVPGVQFKRALDYTARQLGIRIPGRGAKTWASIFESGVLCTADMPLGLKVEDIGSIGVMCNSKGRRGGSLDVQRRFPIIYDWGGTVAFTILNDMIDEHIFRLHLERAGEFCGLGRYAPRNAGTHGRFTVEEVLWQDAAVAERKRKAA